MGPDRQLETYWIPNRNLKSSLTSHAFVPKDATDALEETLAIRNLIDESDRISEVVLNLIGSNDTLYWFQFLDCHFNDQSRQRYQELCNSKTLSKPLNFLPALSTKNPHGAILNFGEKQILKDTANRPIHKSDSFLQANQYRGPFITHITTHMIIPKFDNVTVFSKNNQPSGKEAYPIVTSYIMPIPVRVPTKF